MTKNRLTPGIFYGIASLTFFLILGLWLVEQYFWVTEYRQRTPNQIFAEVMGIPVPSGVTNLKVVARQLLIKRWVKISFNATPSTLQALTQGKDRAPKQMWRQALGGKKGVANDKFDAMDLKTIGWQNMTHIKKPEIYRLTNGTAENFLWDGFLIIDRPRGIAFVHAGGD